MNERIKELMEKSGMISTENATPGTVWTTNMSVKTAEKFAELLVKEAGAYLMRPEFIGRSDLDWSMVLNEHFGVEE